MASVNKVMLIGNLTRDPEVRYTPKGSAVADIGLAINRYFTMENGEKREETTFVDVVLWGRQAELAQQYLGKGRPVFIEGRLQLDTWDDKTTGQKRSKLRVVGEVMQFLGSPKDNQGGGGESTGGGGGGYQQSGGDSGGGGGGGGGGYQQPASPPPAAPAAPTAPPTQDNDGAQFDSSVEEEDDIPF
ncbi:MAG: single-strand DNA-binding protein [Verrucomicrobiales bacterium]|jgi:single-strand DNA-binding protein